MKEKMTAHKYFRQNSNSDFWQHSLKFLQDHLNNSVKFPEGKYYNGMVSKLQNTKESSKSYQFLLSIFSKDRKIPLFHRISAVIILFQMSNKSPIYLTLN